MFCFTERHFLLDDMFYLRVCIIGGHVLQFIPFHWNTGICVLQEGIFYWMIHYIGGQLLYGDRFAGWYVLEEFMYYMKACLAGGHVQLEYM